MLHLYYDDSGFMDGDKKLANKNVPPTIRENILKEVGIWSFVYWANICMNNSINIFYTWNIIYYINAHLPVYK